MVHEGEESGYWAEVPAIAGRATHGETSDELLANVHDAVEASLSVEVDQPERNSTDRITEMGL